MHDNVCAELILLLLLFFKGLYYTRKKVNTNSPQTVNTIICSFELGVPFTPSYHKTRSNLLLRQPLPLSVPGPKSDVSSDFRPTTEEHGINCGILGRTSVRAAELLSPTLLWRCSFPGFGWGGIGTPAPGWAGSTACKDKNTTLGVFLGICSFS